MTKASSKVKTPSRIYWEKRESQNLQSNLKVEETYSKKVQSILEYTQDQIQKEINGFYTKYANKEGITMADAKQRVSSLDIAEYERKAEKYVAEKDFSDKANEEMRLYNATMKINRLELLKANIGLELVAGYDEMDKYMGEVLDERTLAEIRRQAGILGDGVSDPGGTAKTIAGASYRGATYSERIWTHQAMLKSELDKLLTEGMMQGRNPKVLARHLTKTFGTSKYNAERLMRTELARVQIAAQEKSYLDNGWTEFEFVSIGSACSVCLALDGKHFKVKDMTIAENAPPMHPNCRCSTAPYEGGEEYEKWINSYGEHGLSFEKWKESANIQKKELYTKNRERTLESERHSAILITGARITDLYSKEADDFADMYYKEIRSFSTDSKSIAENLGKKESDIRKIKAYLFEEDSLIDPETGEKRRFDPDCAIAQSWQRLMIGKDIKQHDKTLIEHELLEMKIKEENPGIDHIKAHEIAAKEYDYPKEALEYYGNLEKYKKNE